MLAVVAHTKRAQQAHQLHTKTGAAYTSIDNGTLGCNGNHLKVWRWLAQHNTDEWSIVLEDDALPVDDFTNQVKAALDNSPTPVVSFYLGKHHIPTLDIEKCKQQAIARADTAGAHWITSKHLLHAVAIAVRTEHLKPMLDHLATLPDFFPIDEAITHWANHSDHDIAYTWPSIVDHADQPTLFRHFDKIERTPGRVAYNTGTRDHWTDRSVTL